MNPILEQKIRELIAAGEGDSLKILQKLNERSVTYQDQTVPRAQFPSEYKLYSLLVPSIVTVEEMVAVQGSKVDYVTQKLISMFNTVSLEQKLGILALQGQLQMAFVECEKAGSLMFSDPKFMQQTEVVQIPVQGQSFLEENGFEVPDESEIRGVK